MTRNIGNFDRLMRFLFGIALLSLLFIVDGPARFTGLFGLIPIATSVMGFCALYTLLGLNTIREK
jgi:Protein of unknown function (DUF2892)